MNEEFFDSHGRKGLDAGALARSLSDHLAYTVGKDSYTATPHDYYTSLVRVVRDRLIEKWMETMRSYYRVDAKRIYYLSLEFLPGRALVNSLLNTGLYEACREAVDAAGLDFAELVSQEPDAALGNGGLGRLAACILDSMATLDLPGYGYGLRYEYGMFYQRIDNGSQVEQLEHWLRYGNPWEFARPEVIYPVRFSGRVITHREPDGSVRYHWTDTENVMAMAYDTPVPGYGNETVNNMRLWSAKAAREFDLKYFNRGDYIRAMEDRIISENLTRVLYPSDLTEQGRELRLQQEYFFVSASLQDILYRFSKHHASMEDLPEKAAVQLNDTHPALAVPELMRILVDEEEIPWERSWEITRRVFSYTNHTLLPEALETWPVSLMQALLPRHLQVIYEINHRFLGEVRHLNPGDNDLAARVSLIDERGGRRVRMAHLAAVGSHTVNGVSKVHTQLMKETAFRDLDRHFPGRIVNVTNGVTPRRWLHEANPDLCRLITSRIGSGWIGGLERLRGIEPLADDDGFREEFRLVKEKNKRRLRELIKRHLEVEIPEEALMDVQVKRIHEYKRQLLNILGVAVRYNRICSGTLTSPIPRTVLFAGKAAPGYDTAKLIIRLIHAVADVVNNDPRTADVLKVVFVPNYDVSTACDIIPAADLSQQISTAGREASGTGNMKLALNGALTLGTLDGANIEIREAVGEENFFSFGLSAGEVLERKAAGYRPREVLEENGELKEVLDMVGGGYFCCEEATLFRPLINGLVDWGDPFFILADFAAYMEAQQRVDELYAQPGEWARRAVLNVARMGFFSIDRTVREYAGRIWKITPGKPGREDARGTTRE